MSNFTSFQLKLNSKGIELLVHLDPITLIIFIFSKLHFSVSKKNAVIFFVANFA